MNDVKTFRTDYRASLVTAADVCEHGVRRDIHSHTRSRVKINKQKQIIKFTKNVNVMYLALSW